MQLAARIRPRDLEEFFSSVGKVHDVRLILDNKSHRSKGIAYVEFREVDAVPLALGLNGQRLLGVPIIVQPSHAERNRIASAAAAAAMKSNTTPGGQMRLYVGSLHYNITEDMIRGIFEPFGKIDDLKLMKDHQTGRSAGYGFITYRNAEDAKKALEQLNGFEVAGRPMKVGHVTDHSVDGSNSGGGFYDIDDMDRAGFGLGATGRIQLMAKLAEGTGMQLPQAAAAVLQQTPIVNQAPAQAIPPIATQCFMISNMFDARTKITNSRWEAELLDDIINECNNYGGVVHIFVDRDSEQGNVYVKCPSIAAAVSSVNALHGRYYAGKLTVAAYVPLPNYHQLFPDSARAVNFVLPSGARLNQQMSGFDASRAQ